MNEKIFQFEVPNSPKGKGRPRFAIHGGRSVAFTPKDTESYEEMIRGYAIRSGMKPTKGPVRIDFLAIRGIPASVSRKRARNMSGKACKAGPDCDNIAKALLDALNGIAYMDDKQVCELRAVKIWSSIPRLAVTVYQFDQEFA